MTRGAAILARAAKEGEQASFLEPNGTIHYYKHLGGQWVYTGTVEPMKFPADAFKRP